MKEIEEFMSSMSDHKKIKNVLEGDNVYELCDKALEDLNEIDA